MKSTSYPVLPTTQILAQNQATHIIVPPLYNHVFDCEQRVMLENKMMNSDVKTGSLFPPFIGDANPPLFEVVLKYKKNVYHFPASCGGEMHSYVRALVGHDHYLITTDYPVAHNQIIYNDTDTIYLDEDDVAYILVSELETPPVPALLRTARVHRAHTMLQAGYNTHTLLPLFLGDAELQSQLEDGALFLTSFITCRSMTTRIALILAEVKRHGLGYTHDDLTRLAQCVETWFSFWTEPQSGEEDYFSMTEGWWKKIAGSAFAKSLGKLVALIISIYRFGLKKGVKHIIDGIAFGGADKIFEAGDLFMGLLKGVELVVTKLWQFYQTGVYDDLFHSQDAYVAFEDEYKSARLDYVRLRRNDRTIDRHGLLGRVRDLIDRGTRMMAMTKKLKVHNPGVLDLFQALLKLEEINNEMSSKIDAQRPRMTPIGLLVVGKSSVGKSSFMRMLHVHLCRVRKKERISLEDIYVRNPEDPFYTGHDSTKITIIVDDACIIRPNRIQGVDKTMNEIVFICNTVQAMPLYASLEDKGMNPVMCEQFIISSNVEDLNIPLYFSCPLAIARRLPYRIEIVPQPQYCKFGSSQLDGAKVPEVSFPDIWFITVYKCEVMPGDEDEMKQNFVYDKIASDWTLCEFLPWYSGVIRKHFTIQEKMLDSNDRLCFGEYCEQCDVPGMFCSCGTFSPCIISGDPTKEEYCNYCDAPVSFCACEDLTEAANTTQQAGQITMADPVLMGTLVIAAGHLGSTLIGSWMDLVSKFMAYATPSMNKVDLVITILVALSAQGCLIALATGSAYVNKERICEVVTNIAKNKVRETIFGFVDVKIAEARDGVSGLGDCVAAIVGIDWKIKATVAAITAAIAGWSFYSKISGMQGQMIGQTPDTKHERESCWKKADYVLSDFDIPRQAASLKNHPDDFHHKFMARRMCSTKAYNKDDPTRSPLGNMMCLKGNVFMGPGHTVPKAECLKVKLGWQPPDRGMTTNHEVAFNSGNRVRIAEDTFLYTIDDAQPRTSVEEMFMPKAFATKKFDGFIIGRRNGGDISVITVSNCRYESEIYDGVEYKAWKTESFDSPTIDGDCGSVLVLRTHSGPMIAGVHRLFHRGMFSDTISCVAVFKEDLPPLDGIVTSGTPKLHAAKSRFGELSELHSHSHVRYLDEGRAEVFGSFPVWRSEHRSKMRKTAFYDDLRADGIDLELMPAVMSGWEPDQRNLKKLVTNNIDINEVILRACGDALVSSWAPALPTARGEIFIYDVKTALNGVPGLRFVDRMNFSSSAGFPYCSSKKNFIVANPTPDDPHNVELTADILEDVEHILDAYRQHEMSHPVFQYAKKDEMRPFKKWKDKNTRGINGGPFGFTVVMRQLTLAMTRIMQLNPDVFNLCVGLEAQTAQWDELLKRMKKNGYSKWVAIDCTGFDSSFLTKCMKEAFRCAHRFMEDAGATEEHLKMFECMSYDVTYYMVNFLGTLMQLCGKNPSGHAWTVIINSIVNELYMLYAFVILHPDFVDGSGYDAYHALALQFHSSVKVATYGDDNFLNVSDETPWFNHTAIKDAMSQFGIILTMAEKTAESRPYITEEEVSFLKRKFVFNEEFGKHVAPLELASIYKSLSWNRLSNVDSPSETLSSCVLSATYEFAWHGREVFNRETDRMWKLCVKHSIPHKEFSFDYFVEQFKKNSEAFYEDMRKRGKYLDDFEQGATENWCLDTTYDVASVSVTACQYVPHQKRPHSAIFRFHPCGSIALMGLGTSYLGGAGNLPQRGDPHGSKQLKKVYSCGYKSLANSLESAVTDTAAKTTRVQITNDHDFLTSQTVTFADADAGEIIDFGNPPSDVIVDQTMADLGGFLERPTLIKTITWTEASFADQTFDPWSLFLSNAYIKNKLQNFAYLRGNLKIKVVMNAAPFYYGALLFSYLPLPAQAASLGVSSKRLISFSQRPHMWVFPQTGTAGEMKLPFIWQANYIDLTSAAIVAQLGQFTVSQYSILRSANGATSNGVTLQIYAWMEDHHLVGPTYVSALQGGEDEYGNGPISAPATAVAHWASYLHNIPIIGKFAKATTIGASAVSHIASIFGWTNVPVIDNVQPLKNVPFHDLASAHISEPTAKFTLDPKAELSVDPLIVGGVSDDELAISSLVQRESFIAVANWPTTDGPGTQYFSTVVYPQMQDVSGATSGNTVTIYQTPIAWLCPMFKSWRGDLIFRFKIIASKFHQGRLRISWDPVGTQATASDTSNVVYTKVVDISECDEVEFRVPYLQPLPWSNLGKGSPNVNAVIFNVNNPTTVTATKNVHNGVLSVRCLTNLSAPVDVAPIDILIFVRGAENLEFANPTQMTDYNGVSHIVMQSGSESWDSPVKPSGVPDERYLVNYGEAIPSLRILMRRSCHVDTIPFGYQVKTAGGDHSADKGGSLYLYKPRFPLAPGYDSQGMFRAKGVETPATTYQFNYARMTTLEWVSSAFIACRGAVRWHYNFNCPSKQLTDISVRRLTDTVIGSPYYPQYSTTRLPTDSFSVSGSKLNRLPFQGNAGAGVVVNNLETQTGVSFELPMMTNSRFIVPNPGQWNTPAGDYSLYSDTYLVSAEVKPESYGATALQNLTVSRYVGAGTDYTVSFFLNIPPLYYNGNAGVTPDITDQL